MKTLQTQELENINGGWGWSSFTSAVSSAVSTVSKAASTPIGQFVTTAATTAASLATGNIPGWVGQAMVEQMVKF